MPGVRELFEQEPPPPPRKTRAELMKDIDADYYGYRDDDDGILIPLEQEDERNQRQALIDKWESEQKDKGAKTDEKDEVEDMETNQMQVLSQKEIQEVLLMRKKQALLEKYVY